MRSGMRWAGFIVATMMSCQMAFGWGNRGHEMVTEMGNSLVNSKVFENCHISAGQLVEHSTDPDLKWRRDRRRHPDEEYAHFFHVDHQTAGWETRREPEDKKQGFLVYRVGKWLQEAKKMRAEQNWSDLSEHLFGLTHYLGDISMPLHLTSNHDGGEFGLPDLHKQWESKMLQRYDEEIRVLVKNKIKREGIPPLWAAESPEMLLSNIAKESYGRVPRLIRSARDAVEPPTASRRRRALAEVKPRFSKPKLYAATRELVVEQLALSSKLWAHFLGLVCN